ncbi:class I SAM-dependent methyltransferase [Aurantibacillus circumpalustris]|uniref:class I SAM-dependent methyltransferase n=1 Tax=Aurantibacillus circumpalustris TaxID=3036359 RepID=UPI00295B90C4|nr:class I SAM-dependent methyltransferase [Aurantibacillus circumpalustris]
MSDFLHPKLSSPFYFVRTGLFNAATSFSEHTNGGRLLDFGCGSKPYRSLFKVDEYVGLDYENEGHPHNEEQIDIFYDGGKLPFKDAEFDYILCTEVFEHLFDLDDKIAEFNRVLKKDGLLFVTCPFLWNEHEIPYDFARYTSFALNHKFKNKGFEVLLYKKGGTFIETYTQAFFLYFSRKDTRYKSEKIGILKKFIIFNINVIGKILNKLLPDNDSLYLSNIYIVKKAENLV